MTLAAGQKAATEGMNRADAAACPEWKELMSTLLEKTARELPHFTADDVFDKYDLIPEPKPHTHENRAFGPVVSRGMKAGWFKKSELPHRASTREELHACPRRVWESLIYNAAVTG